MASKYVYILLCTAMTLSLSSTGGTAQVVTVASQSESVQSPAAVLHAKSVRQQIALDVRNAPLQTVLESIAHQAGLTLLHGKTVFEQTSPVTSKATYLSADDAFAGVLRGTGIRVVISLSGQAVVTRTPAAETYIVQGILLGKVLHERTKQPVAGATITIGDGQATVTSGNDGTFRASLPAGEYVVHVRALGFTRFTKKIVIADEQTVVLETLLAPSASVLDEVIVTGTVVATERRAIPNPITVITAEEIEKRGITRIEQFFRGEVPGVLALEQGTKVYQSGSINSNQLKMGAYESSAIYARGSSNVGLESTPTPLKTFVDGVELLDPSYLGTLDIRGIERIEIITGPQAATIYGSGAMGGVMQIFTKRGGGRSEEIQLSLRFGLLETTGSTSFTPSHNHSVGITGGSGGTLSYTGNASYSYTGQWQPGLYNRMTGVSAGVTDSRSKLTIGGSVNFTSGSNGTIRYAGDAPAASPTFWHHVATGRWFVLGVGRAPPQEVAMSSSQMFSFNMTYRATRNWQHTVTAGRNTSRFQLQPKAPEFVAPNDSLFRSSSQTGQRATLGYNTSLQIPRFGFLSSSFSLGVNGSSGDQDGTYGCLASKTSGTYIDCGTGTGNTITVRKSLQSESWGGFGTWRLSAFNRMHLTLGLRGERNPAYGMAHKIDWTPNNGLTFNVDWRDVTIKLLGSYGRATRAPVPDNRIEIIGCWADTDPSCYIAQAANADLRPEYSRGPQGGIEVYMGNRGSFTINRYQQTITDLIQRITVDTVRAQIIGNPNSARGTTTIQYFNIAKVRQHGWETTGSLNLGKITVKGTHSWNDSRILKLSPRASYVGGTTIAQQMYVGRSFRGLPTHSGHLSFAYAHEGTSIVWATNFIGASSVHTGAGGSSNVEYSYTRLKIDWPTSRFQAAEQRKPGYAKTDVSFMQRLTPWATATANITNMFNGQGSEVVWYIPVLGRRTMLGMSIRNPLGR